MWYIYIYIQWNTYLAIVSFEGWDNYGDCVLSSFPLLVLKPLVPFLQPPLCPGKTAWMNFPDPRTLCL